MPRLVGEADDLGLQRRAVARPGRLDLAGVHRRAVQVRPDQLVQLRRRVGDPAGQLPAVDPLGEEGEGFRLGVAGLKLGFLVVDGCGGQPGRRAGLEAGQPNAQALQGPAQALAGRLAHAAARRGGLADVEQAAHEGAGAENDRRGPIDRAAGDANAADALLTAAGFHHEVLDGLLAERQSRLLLAEAADFLLIGPLVGLRPRAVHGRPLAAVEHAEVDGGGVDGAAHESAQGVDLADQLPLGQAADGWIAAHLGDGVEVAREQCGPRAVACCRRGRLRARMAAADHQDVEIVRSAHLVHDKGARGQGPGEKGRGRRAEGGGPKKSPRTARGAA